MTRPILRPKAVPGRATTVVSCPTELELNVADSRQERRKEVARASNSPATGGNAWICPSLDRADDECVTGRSAAGVVPLRTVNERLSRSFK
jgi:hypothetical protein